MLVIRYFVFIVLFALGSLSSSHAFDLKKLEGELGNALKGLEQNLNKVAPKEAQPETAKKPAETKTKKVESVTASGGSQISASDIAKLNAELDYLSEKRILMHDLHSTLINIPDTYLKFQDKKLRFEGREIKSNGTNCGKEIQTLTLQSDGNGTIVWSSERCASWRFERSGIWRSEKHFIALAYTSQAANGATEIFVENYGMSFRNDRIRAKRHDNLGGKRQSFSKPNLFLKEYLDLKTGVSLPIGGNAIDGFMYQEALITNAEKKTALFGVKVLDNPSNYKISNKRKGKEVRPIAGNTLTEILEAKYGAKVEFNFYDVVPPIKNKSFYDYKIRTVSVNGIEVVSNINARANCPMKGIKGCEDFFNAIDEALFKKYGFVSNEDADFLDDKKNIYTVRLSSMGTVDGEFTTGAGYLNVDGLWMSLGIKWSEESLLAKFGIDPSSKKSVDTNF